MNKLFNNKPSALNENLKVLQESSLERSQSHDIIKDRLEMFPIQAPLYKVSVKIKPERKDFKMPEYKSEGASGMDLAAVMEKPLTLYPNQRVLIPTGFSLEIPLGYEAQIRPRSGLAFKEGLTVANTPGTIDSDFRGEVKVCLINLSNEPVEICNGDRIAQMVFAPVIQARLKLVSVTTETERGAGGFGSTGKS